MPPDKLKQELERKRIDLLAGKFANQEGIDPSLFTALIGPESTYDPNAVSPKGATGLVQIMPEHYERLGITDPTDITQNLRGGAQILREEIDRFGGDPKLGVAAYNAGSPKVIKAIEKAGLNLNNASFEAALPFLPAETQNYVRKVFGNISDAIVPPAGGEEPEPNPRMEKLKGLLNQKASEKQGDTPQQVAESKPRIQNPDGSVSTERTISIGVDGKEVLIPTIFNGKQLSNEQAISLYREGKINPIGTFNTVEEANEFAQQRSNQIGQSISGNTANLNQLKGLLDQKATELNAGQPQQGNILQRYGESLTDWLYGRNLPEDVREQSARISRQGFQAAEPGAPEPQLPLAQAPGEDSLMQIPAQFALGVAEGVSGLQAPEELDSSVPLVRGSGQLGGLLGLGYGASGLASKAIPAGAGFFSGIRQSAGAGAIFGGTREAGRRAQEERSFTDSMKSVGKETALWGGLHLGGKVGLEFIRSLKPEQTEFLTRIGQVSTRQAKEKVVGAYNWMANLFGVGADDLGRVVDDVAPDTAEQLKIVNNLDEVWKVRPEAVQVGPTRINKIFQNPQPTQTPGTIKGFGGSFKKQAASSQREALMDDVYNGLVAQGMPDNVARTISGKSFQTPHPRDAFLPVQKQAEAAAERARNATYRSAVGPTTESKVKAGQSFAGSRAGDITEKGVFPPKPDLHPKAQELRAVLEDLKNLAQKTPEEQLAIKQRLETLHSDNIAKEFIHSPVNTMNKRIGKLSADDITNQTIDDVMKEIKDYERIKYPTPAKNWQEAEVRARDAMYDIGFKKHKELMENTSWREWLTRKFTDQQGNVQRELRKKVREVEIPFKTESGQVVHKFRLGKDGLPNQRQVRVIADRTGQNADDLTNTIIEEARLINDSAFGQTAANIQRTVGAANYEVHGFYNKWHKAVFGELPENQRLVLNKLIANNAEEDLFLRKMDDVLSGKYKMPMGNKEIKAYQNYRETLRRQVGNDDVWRDLETRAGRYFQANKELLKMRRDAGLIDDASYEVMKNNKYMQRQHLDDPEAYDPTIAPGVSMSNVINQSDDTIKTLKEGSVRLQNPNAEYLLMQNTTIATAAKYKNRANQALWEFAEASPKNKLGIKMMQNPNAEPLPNHVKFYNFVNGQRRAIQMPEKYASEWTVNDPVMQMDFANIMSWATGANTLRMTATGLNPGFALFKNPFMDLNLFFFQPEVRGLFSQERSAFLPKYLFDTARSMRRTFKGAFAGKGHVHDLYEKHGAATYFYSHQGFGSRSHIYNLYNVPGGGIEIKSTRLHPAVDSMRKWMSRSGDFMERWMRESALDDALRNRNYYQLKEQVRLAKGAQKAQLQKQIDSVITESVQVSRSYLDFMVGGSTTKGLDKFIPYVNARLRVADSMVQAAKNDPGLFTIKAMQMFTAQMAALEAGRRLIGHENFGNFLREMDDQTMLTHLTVPIPGMVERDSKGKKRQGAFAIPIEPTAGFFTGSATALYEEFMYGDTNKTLAGRLLDSVMSTAGQTGEIAKAISPFSVADTFPPLMQALVAVKAGHNMFFDSQIGRGGVAGEEEFTERTGHFARDLGQLSSLGQEGQGLSPQRIEAGLGSFFASNNIFIDALGGAYALALHGEESIDREILSAKWIKEQSLKGNIPFVRRFIKWTSYDDDIWEQKGVRDSEAAAKAEEYNRSYRKLLELWMEGSNDTDDVFEHIGQYPPSRQKIFNRRFKQDQRFFGDENVPDDVKSKALALRYAYDVPARARLYWDFYSEYKTEEERKMFDNFLQKIGGVWTADFGVAKDEFAPEEFRDRNPSTNPRIQNYFGN